jgi:4-hydroxybenzoate polyprenyltransferase
MAAATAGLFLTSWPQINFYDLSLVLIASGLGVSAYAEIINDIFDYQPDTVSSRKKLWGIPLAGGSGVVAERHISISSACSLAIAQAVLGLVACGLISKWATITYVVGIATASAYSIPPVRLKEHGIGAVLGHIVGYGLIAFHLGVLGGQPAPTWRTIMLSLFIGLWVGIIGLTADLLDLEDDSNNGLKTFAVKLGRVSTTHLIIVVGSVIFSWTWFLTRSSSVLHSILGVIILTLFVFYTIGVWRFRKSCLPSSIHGIAILMEILFPFFLIS